MRAGRELDALVADKVMGWTNIRAADDWMLEWEDVWGDCPGAKGNPHCIPHYSSDLSAAWQVVEKMRERGLYVAIDDRLGGYWCEFADGSHNQGGQAISEAISHAICLASLRALGVEVGE